jgi:hypothetical protein
MKPLLMKTFISCANMIMERVNCNELERNVIRAAYIAIPGFTGESWRKPQSPMKEVPKHGRSTLCVPTRFGPQHRLCDALCMVGGEGGQLWSKSGEGLLIMVIITGEASNSWRSGGDVMSQGEHKQSDGEMGKAEQCCSFRALTGNADD